MTTPPSPPKEPMSDEPSEADLFAMYNCDEEPLRAVYRAGRASRDPKVAELEAKLAGIEGRDAAMEPLRNGVALILRQKLHDAETELARLRADSMRGAVEMLMGRVREINIEAAAIHRRGDHVAGIAREKQADALERDVRWLESQAPKADPEREAETERMRVLQAIDAVEKASKP